MTLDLDNPRHRLAIAGAVAIAAHLALLIGWWHGKWIRHPRRPLTVTWLDAGLTRGSLSAGGHNSGDDTHTTTPILSTPARNAPAAAVLTRHSGGQTGAPFHETGRVPHNQRSAYLALWRAKVETVGTRDFPQHLIHDSHPHHLVLSVTMGADGRVLQDQIARSSGNPALDRAALHILADAAPFPPFPPAMAARAKTFSFTYEWEFLPGGSHSAGEALSLGRQPHQGRGKSP